MRYIQVQIRELLPVSADAFCIWRNAILTLAEYKNYASSLMPENIVTLSVVSRLCYMLIAIKAESVQGHLQFPSTTIVAQVKQFGIRA